MLPLIHDGPNSVLDLGCASGVMGRKLLETGKAKEMVGVEIFSRQPGEARQFYKHVYVGDIEDGTQLRFQFISLHHLGDILEHLKESLHRNASHVRLA